MLLRGYASPCCYSQLMLGNAVEVRNTVLHLSSQYLVLCLPWVAIQTLSAVVRCVKMCYTTAMWCDLVDACIRSY